MKYIILGGTGYLGGKLIDSLMQYKETTIICLKRKISNLKYLEKWIDKITLCDIGELDDFLDGETDKIDWFINAACRYCKNGELDEYIMDANLMVPLTVFLICKRHGVKNNLTIGTGLPEDFNVYCKSKAEFSRIGKWYAQKESGICFYNILLENFYGGDEPQDRFLHHVVKQLKADEEILLTDGDQHRDFIHIDDVIENINYLLLRSAKSGYHDIPLGSGEGPTIRELVEYMHHFLRSGSKLSFGAVPKRMDEPDSVADIGEMQKWGLTIRHDWKTGIPKIL